MNCSFFKIKLEWKLNHNILPYSWNKTKQKIKQSWQALVLYNILKLNKSQATKINNNTVGPPISGHPQDQK